MQVFSKLFRFLPDKSMYLIQERVVPSITVVVKSNIYFYLFKSEMF